MPVNDCTEGIGTDITGINCSTVPFISKSSGRRAAVFIGREEGMSLISHLNALTK